MSDSETTITYMAWFDASKGKPPAMKIGEAIARYRATRGQEPTVVWVNTVDVCELPGVTVRTLRHVAPNNFLIGRES